MSPHAAKDTPDRLWSTSSSGTGGPRSVSAGIWATRPAAAVATHSAGQSHRLRAAAVSRPSRWTRARAGGRAISSLAPTAHVIKGLRGRGRLNPRVGAPAGYGWPPLAPPARGHGTAGGPDGNATPRPREWGTMHPATLKRPRPAATAAAVAL